MTREMMRIGLLATMLIVVVMGINLFRESDRQTDTVIDLRVEAVIALHHVGAAAAMSSVVGRRHVVRCACAVAHKGRYRHSMPPESPKHSTRIARRYRCASP